MARIEECSDSREINCDGNEIRLIDTYIVIDADSDDVA
jgi:hypothetical protein